MKIEIRIVNPGIAAERFAGFEAAPEDCAKLLRAVASYWHGDEAIIIVDDKRVRPAFLLELGGGPNRFEAFLDRLTPWTLGDLPEG